MELQTERSILRAWQESDAESLYKYAQNPNVGPISGWQPHTSVEDSREILENLVAKGFLALLERGKYCRANFRDENIISTFLTKNNAVACKLRAYSERKN